MTRDEHLAWARERALGYAGQGQITEAIASLTSDLGNHPETAGHPGIVTMTMLAAGDWFAVPGRLRDFIESFS